jgi:hypothetical protein
VAADGAETKRELRLSLDDRFTVADTEKWTVKVEKELPLRLADVRVEPKKDSSFSLMLYLKCDTPDLAAYDSPERIEQSVRSSSEKYLGATVEKKVELKQLNVKGWYGWYTVLTDAKLAKLADIPEGEFKYITRGMVRLSKDSVLGFSLMTNDLGGPEYKQLLDYISSFVKAKKAPEL